MKTGSINVNGYFVKVKPYFPKEGERRFRVDLPTAPLPKFSFKKLPHG